MKLKTAVIGVGYLGKFHAEKYAGLLESKLIGVVDIDKKKGEQVAAELGVNFYEDFYEILDLVDAVSIVVPTVLLLGVPTFTADPMVTMK